MPPAAIKPAPGINLAAAPTPLARPANGLVILPNALVALANLLGGGALVNLPLASLALGFAVGLPFLAPFLNMSVIPLAPILLNASAAAIAAAANA